MKKMAGFVQSLQHECFRVYDRNDCGSRDNKGSGSQKRKVEWVGFRPLLSSNDFPGSLLSVTNQ